LSEYELVQKVKPILQKSYQVYEEVKIFTRAIDIVLQKENQIISIEFKLNNWQKAFEQISDYQIVSDYSYLCTPKKNLRNSTLEQISNLGIGLLSYDDEKEELVEIIKPLQSTTKVDYYKCYLQNKLNKYIVED